MAKYSYEKKLEILTFWRRGNTYIDTQKKYGVSPATLSKWIKLDNDGKLNSEVKYSEVKSVGPGISKERFSGQVVAETGDYVCVPTELWNLMCVAFASVTYKNKSLDVFKTMAYKLMELVL